jgi:arsenate reductase-like glutaredoxin family protein
VTCKKAQGFLGHEAATVTETVNAAKVRYSAEDALRILDGVEKLIAAKGKKIATFDLKNDRPTDEVLLAHLMGPTGNLRAPTIRIGKTLVVGFSEEVYREVLA